MNLDYKQPAGAIQFPADQGDLCARQEEGLQEGEEDGRHSALFLTWPPFPFHIHEKDGLS